MAKCDANNLCKEAKERYLIHIETGICPRCEICSVCGKYIACNEGKYVLDNEVYCIECYSKRGIK